MSTRDFQCTFERSQLAGLHTSVGNNSVEVSSSECHSGALVSLTVAKLSNRSGIRKLNGSTIQSSLTNHAHFLTYSKCIGVVEIINVVSTIVDDSAICGRSHNSAFNHHFSAFLGCMSFGDGALGHLRVSGRSDITESLTLDSNSLYGCGLGDFERLSIFRAFSSRVCTISSVIYVVVGRDGHGELICERRSGRKDWFHNRIRSRLFPECDRRLSSRIACKTFRAFTFIVLQAARFISHIENNGVSVGIECDRP